MKKKIEIAAGGREWSLQMRRDCLGMRRNEERKEGERSETSREREEQSRSCSKGMDVDRLDRFYRSD